MHRATFVLSTAILCLIVGVLAATFGVVREEALYLVIAAWASALAFVVFFVFLTQAYLRIMARTGTINNRLEETKFLLNRRYEQLAERLDDLLARRTAYTSTSGVEENNERLQTGTSELQDVNARLERAERRILGRLENEALSADAQIRELERIVSSLYDKRSRNNPE